MFRHDYVHLKLVIRPCIILQIDLIFKNSACLKDFIPTKSRPNVFYWIMMHTFLINELLMITSYCYKALEILYVRMTVSGVWWHMTIISRLRREVKAEEQEFKAGPGPHSKSLSQTITA